MSKRKATRRGRQTNRPLTSRLRREIDEAMVLFQEGEVDAAHSNLLLLAQKHPDNRLVIEALVDLSIEIEDWRTYAFYAERLLAHEKGEDRAITLNNLIYAHTELMYPALFWHFAKELVETVPDYEQREKVEGLVRDTEQFLLMESENVLPSGRFSVEDKLELMVQHDRVRFYAEYSEPELAVEVARDLLEKVPEATAVRNNLSLSQFMMGQTAQAIESAQQSLAQKPDDFHALANLVRFHFLNAEFEQANQYAAQLKQIKSDDEDLPIKQAEALAYLGDDEGILAAYERAKTMDSVSHPMLLYLSGVAHYRLGKEKAAWSLWRQALKVHPGFYLAQACLAERNLRAEDRDLPYYWPMSYWLSREAHMSLMETWGRVIERGSERALQRQTQMYLEKRPFLLPLFPHILEKGDGDARELIFGLIRISATQEALITLRDFALGPYGSDDLRLEMLQFLQRDHPALLPSNKKITVWIKGTQTELLLMGFQIDGEAQTEGLPKEWIRMNEKAVKLMLKGNLSAAETVLNNLIAIAPDFPSAHNQLAAVYEQQGRIQEARELTQQIHARFPDYLFARVALAQLFIQDGKFEEAKEMLDPLLERPRLHFVEFYALARAEMELALAQKEPESARQWLNMWESMDPENPELEHWRLRIEKSSPMGGFKKLFNRTNPIH